MRKFLVLDVETGGLLPFRHSLLTIALVVLQEDGQILGRFHEGISQRRYHTTPEALAVNKIDLEELRKTGKSKSDVLAQILNFLREHFGKERPTVVGHNVSLDRWFVAELFESQGYDLNDFVNHRMYDTMSEMLSLHFRGKAPESACSSQGAFAFFGIQNEKPHDALADTEATAQLFIKQMELQGGFSSFE